MLDFDIVPARQQLDPPLCLILFFWGSILICAYENVHNLSSYKSNIIIIIIIMIVKKFSSKYLIKLHIQKKNPKDQITSS